MSYIPTVWRDGETPLNAANLNKLERAMESAATSIERLTEALENGEFSAILAEMASKEYVHNYVAAFAAQNLQGIATETFVQEFVVAFATENLQGVATEAWVKDYLDTYIGNALNGEY